MDILLLLVMMTGLVGVTGLAAAWALLRGFRPRAVVAVGTLTMALVVVALFLLGQWGEKQSMTVLIQDYFHENWKILAQKYAQKGLTPDNIQLFKDFFEKYLYLAFPAWFVFNCVATGLVVYRLASSILSRITPRVSKGVSFREWVLPEPLVFGLILGGLLKLSVPLARESGWLEIAADNFLVFFGALYTLAGLSIVSFFLNKWRFPWFIRVPAYAALLWAVPPPICVIGVLDVWFDFRRMKQPPQTVLPS